jgi:hypothetical protein
MNRSMRDHVAMAALLALGGCGDWFGKDACKAGEQSCDGKQILNCTADLTTGETKWQRFGSCGITGPNLVCSLVDGLAECVPDPGMDSGVGVGAEAGAVKPATGGGGTAFEQTAAADGGVVAVEQVEWARLDVERAEDGTGYAITDVSSASLSFVPVSPVAGEVAAVAYEGTRPVDATMVAFQGSTRATSVWLRAPGVTRVALIASSGAILAERTRAQPSPASVTKVASIRQSLSVALPATLNVFDGGKNLGLIAAGGNVPTMTVVPTEEMLHLVADALNRLPPLAASTVTNVAFTSDNVSFTDLVKQLSETEQLETEAGSTITVRAGEPSAGGTPTDAQVPFPSSWFSTRARTSLTAMGQMIVVNVSPEMMAQYRADPSQLTLDLLRTVAAMFVRMTQPRSLFGDRFQFPDNFPPDVAALLRERVAPLLLPLETFTAAWEQLHNVAVQAKLADPYLPLVGNVPDDQALERGVAAGLGVQGAGADFAEFVARASVPERWNPSPCPDIRGKPLDQVPPRRLVHLSKLETVWGLGYLTTEALRACVGDLDQGEAGSGIRVHTTDAGVLTFDSDVLGSKAPFLNDEVHLTFFGRRQDGTQATMDAAYRGQPGVFRLVPSNQRPDPRLGAGFYLTNPKTDARSQASGGVLLVTRASKERFEAHALMVYQSTNFLGFDLATNVWPLITARYDVPEDQQELADDLDFTSDTDLDVD